MSIIKIQFLENTTAMGALILLYTMVSYPVFIPLTVEEAEEFMISTQFLNSIIMLYDIEENGTLLIGNNYPAIITPKLIGTPNLFNNNAGRYNTLIEIM